VSTFRRGLAVVLGLALVVLTVAFAMRWVDVATREIAAVQAVVPITGAGVVVVTLLALVCGLRRLALVGAVPSIVAVVLAIASFGLTATPTAGGAETVTLLSSNLEFGGGNADDIVKGVRDHRADVVVLVELTPQAVTRMRICPSPGRGSARSCSCKGAPGIESTIARIHASPGEWVRAEYQEYISPAGPF